jgi:plasmid maintenance system antidote protein VapI
MNIMDINWKELALLRGLHPGIMLERELKTRKISKGPFALSINEYPQTLGAITKGKRSMNTALALKIENALGLPEGFLMMLQVYYDIKQEKQKDSKAPPDLAKIRPSLFWDTDISKIDWKRQQRAVIQRILERGNASEIEEMKRFYGEAAVQQLEYELTRTHAR